MHIACMLQPLGRTHACDVTKTTIIHFSALDVDKDVFWFAFGVSHIAAVLLASGH